MFNSKSDSPSFNEMFRQMENFFMNTDITYSICKKCYLINRVAFSFPKGKSPICGKCKTDLPIYDGVNELSITSLETFSQKSPLPLIVDFWAPWCGPCRGFAPTFVEAASRLKNRVVFGKVDTEENQNSVQKFGIKGIPTIIIFFRGKEVSRKSGVLSIDDCLAWINQTIQVLV